MKKTYVKPIMESEVFVASEYIAACFHVWCDTNQTCPHWEHALIPGVTRNPTKPHYDEVVKNVNSGDVALEKLYGNTLNNNHTQHKYYHYSDNYYISSCDSHAVNVELSDRPNASS